MHRTRSAGNRREKTVSQAVDQQQLLEAQRELSTSPSREATHDGDESYTKLPYESPFDTPRPEGEAEAAGHVKSYGIPQDAYGCAIIAITREFQEALYGSDAAFHLFVGLFCMALYVLNLVLQFAIVHFISEYVVSPRIEDVQSLYKEFHGNTFDEKQNFLEDQFHGNKEKNLMAVKLCQIAMTNRFFYSTVLFLWCLAMLKEARNTENLFSNISAVPRCSSVTEMIKTEEDGNRHIVALTLPIRTLLYVLVCIPKLCICVSLLFLGCQWLSATDAFESLVMNTVAMEFVTNIDELLYEVMIPIAFKNEVQEMVFTVETTVSREEQRLSDLRKGFTRSCIYLVSALFWVFFYTEYVQSVFPEHPSDVAPHCAFAWDTSNRPCADFNGRLLGLFAGGSTETSQDCFPFGIPYEPSE